MNLVKKNGNNLWEEAIKAEINQLTDYQTFIVLDSGENIPKGLCTEEDSAKYRSIIGCCIWIILLGRFEVTYATSAK